ncbi:MAG: hypothetical protein U9Q03_03460 [Patescibacteria group bacterium]|nr:hypothetical protein [Patescibacteria group bacterium]
MGKISKTEIVMRAVFIVFTALSIAFAGFMVQMSLAETRISEYGVRFQEFPDYAHALIQGETGITADKLDTRLYSDIIMYGNRLHFPFGPVPVALFLPFALLPGDGFPTLAITFLLLAATGALAFRIAKSRGLTERDALWIAAAYSLGSAVAPLAIPVANSWLVILIANVFLLLALDSHLTKRRVWLTGTFLALATATRPVSAIGILAYVLLTTRWRRETGSKSTTSRLPLPASRLIKLLLPLIFAVLLIGAYNHLRFGDFTESGYEIQWQADPVLRERMTHGSMDLRYLPDNLRYFLIEPPNLAGSFPFVLPDGMGMGIIFGSPFMLYILFRIKRWRKMIKPLAAAAIGLVPALTFYASGFSQIGYRYAVDVYPLLFLALIAAFGDKVPRIAKALITISVIAHIIWMVALFT